jgi:hypothetical protein
MRSSRCPFGRLLGRNWFKCYRYFVTDILVWQRPPKFCVKVGCYYFATQLAGDTARDSRPTRDPASRWLPCRDSRSHPRIPACVDTGIRFPLARKEKPRRSGEIANSEIEADKHHERDKPLIDLGRTVRDDKHAAW